MMGNTGVCITSTMKGGAIMLQEQEIELILGNAKCNLIMHGNSAVPVVSPAHVHPYFELFYVWQGTVEIISDERKYRLGQGQAALIAPNCYHQTFYAPDAVKFNVYFSFEPLSKRHSKEDMYTILTQTFSGSPITVMDSAPEIGFSFSNLREIQTKDCFCREERMRAQLTTLLLAIYDRLTAQSRNSLPADANGSTLYRYELDVLLSRNYTGDISLESLAEHFHLSPKRVSVMIKSLYGKPFRQVKTEMRIQSAKQLLKESDCTVAEIGRQVGYETTRGFLSAFTALTGKTPSQYRREAQQINPPA